MSLEYGSITGDEDAKGRDPAITMAAFDLIIRVWIAAIGKP